MNRRAPTWLAAVLSAVVLTACETTPTTDSEVSSSQPGVTGSSSSSSSSGQDTSTQGIGSGRPFQGHPLDDPNSALATRTIYFDFDSDNIDSEQRRTIEAHAAYLASNAGSAVTLEGHADERGTREYNIGLGDRRARAVRQLMALLGSSGQQLRTVSYGEERPAVEGHDEAAWGANRRVEIIYRSR